MSLKDKLDKLFEEYLEEKEELDELSSTASTPGYQTPYAFGDGSKKSKKKRKDYATNSTGYKLVGETKMKHSDFLKKALGLNEVSYKEYKNDSSATSKQKVNLAIKEINRKLYEIERSVSQNIKLKSENDMEGRGYWKSTKNRMTKIAERLVKIAGNMRELGS